MLSGHNFLKLGHSGSQTSVVVVAAAGHVAVVEQPLLRQCYLQRPPGRTQHTDYPLLLLTIRPSTAKDDNQRRKRKGVIVEGS